MNPSEQDLIPFVVHEARLIDEQRFDEWYELFADDAYYWVPVAPGQSDSIRARVAGMLPPASPATMKRRTRLRERSSFLS